MNIEEWYKLGGFPIIFWKVIDRVFKTNLCHNFIENLQRKSSVKDYPELIKMLYKMETGDELDLNNLNSFNEKIQWLKIYDSTAKKTLLSDKYLVRSYIEELLGKQYLIPLLGVYETFEEIDFSLLPNSFVLKGNHGSGMNIIVKDKTQINKKEIKKITEKWLKTNYAFTCGLELQYKDIKPMLIIEEYIEQLDNNLLDYKIHCFSGEPRIIQIIGDRDIVAHKGKEVHLDMNWQRVDMMYDSYDKYEIIPKKPENFEEMIGIAKKLSKDFRYVRVDLYNVEGRILFGEMTFTPFSGYGRWNSKEAENVVGSWIDIS